MITNEDLLLRIRQIEKRMEDFFWAFRDKLRDNKCPFCYGSGMTLVYAAMKKGFHKKISICEKCPRTEEKLMCDEHLNEFEKNKSFSIESCTRCKGKGIVIPK